MPEIKPLRGVYFSEKRLGGLDNVVTPPFDVITPELREVLAARSPYNMVHVILPEPNPPLDGYEVAANHIDRWRHEGVLIEDSKEFYYLLEQEFQGLDEKTRIRRALIALIRLPESGQSKWILAHERTFPHKIEDRLKLMLATRANLEIVFLLYKDPGLSFAKCIESNLQKSPDFSAQTVDSVVHRVWRVPSNEEIARFFQDKTFYIADGHHRFQTAIAYRDKMRAKENPSGTRPYDYVLVALVACEDPGLTIWPAHRLLMAPKGFCVKDFLDKLGGYFTIEEVCSSVTPREFLNRIDSANSSMIGLALRGGNYYLLVPKPIVRQQLLEEGYHPLWLELDVVLLHKLIVERLLGLPPGAEFTYEPNGVSALHQIERGEKDLAFILRAVRPEQVCQCAEASVYMPEKATYFFPKIPSGLIMRFIY